MVLPNYCSPIGDLTYVWEERKSSENKGVEVSGRERREGQPGAGVAVVGVGLAVEPDEEPDDVAVNDVELDDAKLDDVELGDVELDDVELDDVALAEVSYA